MSDNITIKIDGVECQTQEGEFILEVARANGIYIPAICYLTRCSPTLACRICLVEADGKRVYSCNAKAKDGMEIVTKNEEILEERRAIMEVYDVNHPLQCGVCDQSGECELQNYTLELGVDSQSFSIPDTKRGTADWSTVLHYDAGLCIVCERCVTVCKDMIGDAAIKTGPRGGEPLDKAYKATMPKDAYSMWNKLQKSVIVPSNGTEFTDCSDCGECTAVCPVGALTEQDFVYKSNAWELKQIPATCAHCSSGCHIYYETKHTSIENPEEKIYRVKNEWNYQSLCGAGRFGYDYENRGTNKDKKEFAKAVAAIEKADTIRFNSVITNEEAMMLQTLKEKQGLKLVNHDAKAFQDFLGHYAKATGKGLYPDNYKDIMANSDFVISIGSALRNDNPNVRYVFNNIQKMNKGAGLYFHPVGDTLVPTFGKNIATFEHKPGQEELALYLVLELFADKDRLPKDIADNFDSLVERLGGDAEQFGPTLEKMLKKKESFSLILGEDLYFHPRAKNIANLVAVIEEYCDIKIAMVPPKSNSLGVALICELDDKCSGKVVGYNEPGDYVLSAMGDGNLDIPAMNQQEGTMTNMNKKVVPTNAALEYGGYELNDIMLALGLGKKMTIDWTSTLPMNRGFKAVAFDAMPNHYTNDGKELRGYELDIVEYHDSSVELEPYDESVEMDGEIAYRCNPQRQFNDFTNKSHQIFEAFALYASPEKAEKLGSRVTVEFENGILDLDVEADDRISGDIVEIPDFISEKKVYKLFGDNRYAKVNIRKGK